MNARHQEVINRIEYMYKDVDGNINFPNTFDGDVLKIAYKSAKASLIYLNDNQKNELRKLKNRFAWFDNSASHALFDYLIDNDTSSLNNKEFAGILTAFADWVSEQEGAG